MGGMGAVVRWAGAYVCALLAWGACDRGFRRAALWRVGNVMRRATGRRPLPGHVVGGGSWAEDGVSVRGMLLAVVLGAACVGPASRAGMSGGWGVSVGSGAILAAGQVEAALEAVRGAVAASGGSLTASERREIAEEVARVGGVGGWAARDEVEGVLPCFDSGEDDSGEEGAPEGMCAAWADAGECERNAQYMLSRCRRSCGVCGTREEWGRVADGPRGRPPHTAAPPDVHVVSWNPRIFYIPGFLSDAEADHLMAMSKGRGLSRSTVVGEESKETGKRDEVSNVRTSTGVFLSSTEDPLLQALDGRLARYSRIPPENGEAMQVLHYDPGQLYRPHLDAFDTPTLGGANGRGGQRAATVLMYLGDVEEGGETHFPKAIPLTDAGEVDPETGRPLRAPGHPNTCGGVPQDSGLSVHPRKGDAVLFYTTHLDGTVDPRSMHAGCAVVKGEKWTATKWIRTGVFA